MIPLSAVENNSRLWTGEPKRKIGRRISPLTYVFMFYNFGIQPFR